MAQEVVSTLFGFNPLDAQKEREQEDFIRSYKYAQLDPLQQTAFLGAQGANMFARGSDQMRRGIFNIQDPQMKEAALLDAEFKSLQQEGIDPTSSEGASMLAQRLNAAGASPQTIERVLQMSRQSMGQEAEIASKFALAGQRSREKAAADPVQQMARTGKYTPESLAKYAESRDFRDLEFADKTNTRPEVPETQAEREIYAELVKQFGPLEGARRFTAWKDERDMKKGAAKAPRVQIDNRIPGMKTATDIPKFRNDILQSIKPYRTAVDAAEDAIAQANLAITQNNFGASGALARSLAKSVGEGQISNADVAAFGLDPSLVGRVSDVLSRLASGTPTKDTLRQLRQVAEVVRQKNLQRENAELARQREVAELSRDSDGTPLYKPDELDKLFSTVRPTGKSGKTRTTASGVTYTVED